MKIICPNCDTASLLSDWNTTTEEYYDCGITVVDEDDFDANNRVCTYVRGCIYVCPHCKEEVAGKDLEAER